MDFVHFLDKIFSELSFVIVPIALVTWGGALMAQLRRWKEENPLRKAAATKRYYAFVLVFFMTIALGFLVVGYIKSVAQNEVDALLNAEIISVQVEGKRLDDPTQIISDIRHLNDSYMRYHHSHPTHSFVVDLQTKNGDLHLRLARDSTDPHEYWAYYLGYGATSTNDIGKVYTSTLDKY